MLLNTSHCLNRAFISFLLRCLALSPMLAQSQPDFSMKGVSLRTRDAAQLANWYIKQLDFELSYSTDGHRTLKKGGFRLNLIQSDNAILLDSLKLDKDHSYIAGYYKYGFTVDDLDKLFEQVKRKSLTTAGNILNAGQLKSRSFILIDPEGNYIQFFEKKGAFSQFKDTKGWQSAFIMIISDDYQRSLNWYGKYGFTEVANNDNTDRQIFQRTISNGQLIIELSQVGERVAPKRSYPSLSDHVTGMISMACRLPPYIAPLSTDDSGNLISKFTN